jgi:hypothetical protein
LFVFFCFLSISIYLYLLSTYFTYMKPSNGARRRSTHARYACGRDGDQVGYIEKLAMTAHAVLR